MWVCAAVFVRAGCPATGGTDSRLTGVRVLHRREAKGRRNPSDGGARSLP